MEKMIEINDIGYKYKGEKDILKGINLDIYKGEKLGIVGPNGVGKTTLFKLITGVVKPDCGSVKVCNRQIKQGQFVPEIGMIFQDTDDQLFCPTVYEDISFGPRNMGLSQGDIDKKVNNAMDILGIGYLRDKAPHHLSGGEKRLVAIAGILAMESRIGIYDEPTSNLDMRFRERLINFMNNFSHDVMIVSSHDLEFLIEVCNKIVVIDNGKIIAKGSPIEILSNELLMKQHGLSVPYSLKKQLNKN